MVLTMRRVAAATAAALLIVATACTDDNDKSAAELPDFRTFEFPAETCDDGSKAAAKDVATGNLDGERGDEAAVVVGCGESGTAAHIWAAGDDGPEIVTRIPVRTTGFDAKVVGVELADDELRVREHAGGPSDEACCPSTEVLVSYRFRDSALEPTGTPKVTALPKEGRPGAPEVPFLVGAANGFDLSQVATPEAVDKVADTLREATLRSVSCDLVGDITLECPAELVVGGRPKTVRLHVQPDLPPDVEYVDGRLLRKGAPYGPERYVVIDIT